MGWGARTREGRAHTRTTTPRLSTRARLYGGPFAVGRRVTIGTTTYIVKGDGSLRRVGGVTIKRSAAA